MISDRPFGKIENPDSITAPHVPSSARRGVTLALPERQSPHATGNAPISSHSPPCLSSKIFPFRSCRWTGVKQQAKSMPISWTPRSDNGPGVRADLAEPQLAGEAAHVAPAVGGDSDPMAGCPPEMRRRGGKSPAGPRRTGQKVAWACHAPPVRQVRRKCQSRIVLPGRHCQQRRHGIEIAASCEGSGPRWTFA